MRGVVSLVFHQSQPGVYHVALLLKTPQHAAVHILDGRYVFLICSAFVTNHTAHWCAHTRRSTCFPYIGSFMQKTHNSRVNRLLFVLLLPPASAGGLEGPFRGPGEGGMHSSRLLKRRGSLGVWAKGPYLGFYNAPCTPAVMSTAALATPVLVVSCACRGYTGSASSSSSSTSSSPHSIASRYGLVCSRGRWL